MEVLCQFTKSYRGCKLLCHNNCFPLTFKARGRGLLTARRASGISGLVYGISVNVKHTFLRRRKRKKNQWGKKTKRERMHAQRNNTTCVFSEACQSSLKAGAFTNKLSLWYKTDTTSEKSVQPPRGEVKQDTTEVSENKPRIKPQSQPANVVATLGQFTESQDKPD